jgi:hypothetical protein
MDIAAALACASLIFGLPNKGAPTIDLLVSRPLLDRLCSQHSNHQGCEGAFMVGQDGREYLLAPAYPDFELQVAEACHVLQHRNGVARSEAACHHDDTWSDFWRAHAPRCGVPAASTSAALSTSRRTGKGSSM